MTSASAISRGGEDLNVCLVLCAKITENAEKGGGERGSKKFLQLSGGYLQRGAKNSSMLEFAAFLLPTNLGQPMHSPSALTEHVSLNLA